MSLEMDLKSGDIKLQSSVPFARPEKTVLEQIVAYFGRLGCRRQLHQFGALHDIKTVHSGVLQGMN